MIGSESPVWAFWGALPGASRLLRAILIWLSNLKKAKKYSYFFTAEEIIEKGTCKESRLGI